MKVTLEIIDKFKPCSSGRDNLVNHYPNIDCNMQEFLNLEHIPYADKIWLAFKMLDVSIIKQWSLGCAENVMDNYNKEYPNDTRIIDCIEMVKRYLNNDCTLEELEAARSAAWSAARSVARSVARSAAESAAWSAESAAASAAESAAASVARSAARSAAWSAESAAAQETLNLNILIDLI